MVFKGSSFPTPVAVITTMKEGILNAAPVTWFTPISYDPPLLIVSLKPKTDTAKNITITTEFTLQTVPYKIAQKVHNMAAPYSEDISEPDAVGLKYEKTDLCPVPYLVDSLAWFYCKTKSMHLLGDHYQFVAEVMASRKCFSQKNALLSLGGSHYGWIVEETFFEVDRY